MHPLSTNGKGCVFEARRTNRMRHILHCTNLQEIFYFKLFLNIWLHLQVSVKFLPHILRLLFCFILYCQNFASCLLAKERKKESRAAAKEWMELMGQAQSVKTHNGAPTFSFQCAFRTFQRTTKTIHNPSRFHDCSLRFKLLRYDFRLPPVFKAVSSFKLALQYKKC